MFVRRMTKKDYQQIANLFYDTIHTINTKDYNEQQLAAWAPTQGGAVPTWVAKMMLNDAFVVISDNQVVGFADLNQEQLLDRLYVHKDFQGQGVGRLLVKEIEAQARVYGFTEIRTAASITARPFFVACGFVVVCAQHVENRGQVFENYVMKKLID